MLAYWRQPIIPVTQALRLLSLSSAFPKAGAAEPNLKGRWGVGGPERAISLWAHILTGVR